MKFDSIEFFISFSFGSHVYENYFTVYVLFVLYDMKYICRK